MTRVCFIGNSHLSAIKGGWEAVRAEYSGIEATFFGAPSRELENTAVEDGRLVPKSQRARQNFLITSGGQDAVVIADYDIVVLIAMGFSLGHVLDLYRSHRTEDHKNREGDFTPLSATVFDRSVKNRLACTKAMTYLSLMRETTTAASTEFWLYPQALSCITVLTCETVPDNVREIARVSAIKQAAEWHDEESLYASFSAARANLGRSGHTIFEQPAYTRVSGIFTKPEYSRGSVRLSASPELHPANDYMHMNAEYGSIVVRQILERVGQ